MNLKTFFYQSRNAGSDPTMLNLVNLYQHCTDFLKKMFNNLSIEKLALLLNK